MGIETVWPELAPTDAGGCIAMVGGTPAAEYNCWICVAVRALVKKTTCAIWPSKYRMVPGVFQLGVRLSGSPPRRKSSVEPAMLPTPVFVLTRRPSRYIEEIVPSDTPAIKCQLPSLTTALLVTTSVVLAN